MATGTESAAPGAPRYLAEGCPEVIRGLDLERPALLEASAGTGKTYAIEHLVLRLLTERDLDLESVLVLTFTKKAAGELKEKIRARLAARLAEGADLPAAVRGRLREAWLNFDRASVFTIHGFCERVLRNYAFENRALFAHERADDKEILGRVLVEEMRSTWLSEDSPGGAGYEGFRRLAGRLGLSARGDWKEGILRLAQTWNPYRGDLLLPAVDPAAEAALEAEADAALRDLLAAAGECPAGKETEHPGYLSAQAGKYAPAGRKAAALRDIAQLLGLARELGGLASAGARVAAADAFLKANSRIPSLAEDAARLLPATDRHESLSTLASAWDRFRAAMGRLGTERRKRDFDAERKVVEAVRAGAREYKRSRGILGFDDLIENLCAAVERPELARALRQRYAVCIVDEFQDTDPLQWRIFRKVFLESGGTNPLWLIGDPKQAIYGFRGGDIHTYLDARQALFALSREGKAGGYSLGANYRSSRGLIEACNAVFDHKNWFRVREPVPGDAEWRLSPDPDPLGYLPVTPGGRSAQECREGAPDGAARPIILRDLASIPRKRDAQREMNRWIASEILALMAAPERLLIPEGGGSSGLVGLRPLDWGDICVLTRTNTEIRALEAEFRRRGIPFQIHKRTGLWQSGAATEFLALLESLENPRDPGKHARALLTRFFRTRGVPSLAAPPAEVHPAFEAWMGLADRRHWQRLFHELLYGTGLLYRESLEGDGDRRIMDFLHVAQNLVQEALRENLSLPALVQRLRDMRLEAPDPEDERHLHREDSESRKVALMTYHISKGLEFPVVFLGGMAGSQGDAALRYHADGRTVFNLDKADAEAAAAARLEAEQEERRLFYVAFTRPRFKLYIPLPAPLFKPRTNCPLGGFVADAVRAAAERRPDLFHWRSDRELEEAARLQIRPAPEVPGSVPAGTLFIPPEYPGEFPRDPALSGPAADFSRRRMTLTSYSHLVRGRTLEAEGAEGRYDKDDAPIEAEADAEEAYAEAPAAPAGPVPAIPGNALPRGRGIGNMFHEILEDVDFALVGAAGSPRELLESVPARELLETRLAEHQVDPTHIGDVARVIWNVLNAPVPDCGSPESPGPGSPASGGAETFRFADLRHRRHEMEFLFPYPGGAAALRGDGSAAAGGDGPAPPGSDAAGQGYLWGYIDLVFRREGRYYLLDWKSNWLEDYGTSALREDIAASRYDLQYMLYSMALDRWLRSLLPDYDPARHFGGVYYVYLRGLDATARPGAAGPGQVPGVFALRPTPRQVAEDFPAHLDRALGRKPA